MSRANHTMPQMTACGCSKANSRSDRARGRVRLCGGGVETRIGSHGRGDDVARRARLSGGLTGALALVALSSPLAAQTIGTAATVRNDVAQVKGSAAAPIVVNEDVIRNEVVRTGPESATRLVFRDSTNLAVGPTSTVTLDRFVFSGDETNPSKVGVNLVRGAFRFTTGVADKKAYEIKTPVATIGVRGTIFDTFVAGGRTYVKVDEGQVIVCTRDRRPQCTTVNAGQSVLVTAGGVSRIAAGSGPAGLDFAQFCGADGLCEASRFASGPAGTSFASVLCGR